MTDYINNKDSNSNKDKMKQVFKITFYMMFFIFYIIRVLEQGLYETENELLFTLFVSILVLAIFIYKLLIILLK